MKIILVSLYLFDNLATRSLHAALSAEGHDVTTLYLKELFINTMKAPTSREIALFLRHIREEKPDIVGFSVRTPFIRIADHLARMIKEETAATVFYGGLYPTMSPRAALAFADIVCVGDGENVFIQLAKKGLTAVKKEGLPGLWWKHNGAVNGSGYAVESDVDRYSFYAAGKRYYIDHNRMEMEKEKINNRIQRFFSTIDVFTRGYSTMAGRGCPLHCSFCVNALLKDHFPGLDTVRQRRTAGVIAELQAAYAAQHMETVYFHDDIFTADRAWAFDFMTAYKTAVGLPFMINTHIQYLDYDLLTGLRDAGLRIVKIGIQSGSERISRMYRRPLLKEKLQTISRQCRELDIFPLYDIIIDNPFESEPDKKETFALLSSLARPYKLMMYSLVFFPEYPLTKYAQQQGIPLSPQQPEKVYTNWYFKFLKREAAVAAFWHSLFWLSQVDFLSRRLLQLLSRNAFLRRYPCWLKMYCLGTYVFAMNVIIEKLRIRSIWMKKTVSA